jgi:hypothetical protein
MMFDCYLTGRRFVLGRLCRTWANQFFVATAVIFVAATAIPASAQDPPVINDFYCINDIGDYWTLTGVVTDEDSSVEGDVITFGGVLASYGVSTTADVDGTFSVTVVLRGLPSGTATAQTHDSSGLYSALAEDWIWR